MPLSFPPAANNLDAIEKIFITAGGDFSKMAVAESLQTFAKALGADVASEAFAAGMDAQDELAHLRQKFWIPKVKNLPDCDQACEDDCVYLCGNSLGLQPRETQVLVNEELDKWGRRGVIGHFDDSPRPWVSIDQTVVGKSADVVGALPAEVAIMNSLTVNLHLLMVPFYRPTAERHKIVIESRAFPSDHYAVCSQISFHGFDPKTSLIEVHPREGEHTLRTEDILALIAREGSSIALVMLSGVQFYSGQFFDLAAITAAAHKEGCIAGFDLAHAVGNVRLQLHDWNVDFACWCSYKYLNAGPGGIAGAFVHERHNQLTGPRFGGWWGVEPATRFKMDYDTPYQAGVRGLQLSNPPVLQTVSLLASLNVFAEATMPRLRHKSEQLTGYLELLLDGLKSDAFTIITPRNTAERGCQLSLLFAKPVRPIFTALEHRGCIGDLREPNVLRIAPTPLYNTFADVFKFVHHLKECLALSSAAATVQQ